MTKTFQNPATYIVIIALVGFLIIGIQNMGVELVLNNNSILDNNSIEYIADINHVNLSSYAVTEDELEDPLYIKDNASQGNPKDYGLEFLFTKEKGLSVENSIKTIYEIPSFILFTILKLPQNNWAWLINIVIWFLAISVTIMLILFARGVIKL